MYYTYFVNMRSVSSFKDGRVLDGSSWATIKIRFAMGDFDSILQAQKIIEQDYLKGNPGIESIKISILSFQLISTNPF